jgi:hypothetical protein
MNSPEACRKRLLKYLIPVLILAILFNLPKFMEARIEFIELGPTPAAMEGVLANVSYVLAGENSSLAGAVLEQVPAADYVFPANFTEYGYAVSDNVTEDFYNTTVWVPKVRHCRTRS